MIEEIHEELKTAVDTRIFINSVLWKDYNALAKVFAHLFTEDDGTLKLISDMNYYKGGYPSENTPPRLETVCMNIGRIARYFNAIGRLDEMNKHLENYGFEIKTVGNPEIVMKTLNSEMPKPVQKKLDHITKKFGFTFKTNPNEMIQWFIDQTYELQSEICSQADSIKIDLFAEVEAKIPDIDKGGFVRAVNSSAAKKIKVDKQKDPNSVIEKALDAAKVMKTNADLLEETINTKI